MYSTFILSAVLIVSCAATQHPPPESAEVKTTFLTLTKPCASSTSSIAAQNTPVKYEPAVKEYTSYPVVQHTTTTTHVQVQNIVIHTPKVEEVKYVSTTHVVVQNTHPPPPKYETSTGSYPVIIAEYTPPPKHETTTAPPLEQKSTAVYTPKMEEKKSTTTSHVVVQNTYSTTPKHETTTTTVNVEQKSTSVPTIKQETTPYTTKLYQPPANTQANEHPPPVKQDTSASSYTTYTPVQPPPTKQENPSTTTKPPAHPPATKQATTSSYAYTYFPSAACTCPTETPSASPSPTYLPSLPLKPDALQAFSSLLNIVISIPDAILSEGDAAVTKFYTNLSTCVSSKGETLKQSFLSLSPIFSDIGDTIEEGVKEVGDFIGDLISDAVPVATSVVDDIIEQVTALPDAVTSALGPIVTGLLPNSVSSVSRKRQAPAAKPSTVLDILNNLDALRACLSSAISSNPVFEAANCALSIASIAFPAAKMLRVKRAIGAVEGGSKRVLQTLGKARSVDEIVQGAGRGVLDVFGELSGLADVVRDCRFIVE